VANNGLCIFQLLPTFQKDWKQLHVAKRQAQTSAAEKAALMTGMLEGLKQKWRKRKADRRVENMFKSPQGFDRRRASDRRLEGMPTHKP
jgi:hypothetical protein